MVRPASGGGSGLSFALEIAGFAMSGDDAQRGRERETEAAADGDLSARLRRLDAQLAGRRATVPERGAEGARQASGPSPLGRAFRMSTEFVAGVIAGGGLGWLFDRFVGTSPWGLIVFLMLGFGAGIYNVMRASGFLTPAAGAPRPGREGH